MKLENKNIFFVALALCLSMAACSKMDAYKEFGGGKELLYTGKPDSVIAYSGKNRIKLSWIKSSDPKVVKTRIFWNNRKDSIDIVASAPPAGSKRNSTIINNLPEGNYNFELFNYDNSGNRSVVSRVAGSVYGDVYQKTLINRSIQSFGKQFDMEGNTAINWYGSETKSVGVEILYQENSGANKKLIVPPSASATLIANYNISNPISYRTMFLPDSGAIDTFYTAPLLKSVNNPNQINIKNSGYPFKPSKTVGRWSDVADWITTDPEKNQAGGVGGLDNLNTSTENYMSFEFWGRPAIINGKIYQTGTLLPGSYRLVVSISNVNNNLENTYISVAKGTIIPDIANINTSVSSFRVTNGSLNNKDVTLSFTLTQQEVISLGVVSIMQTVNESSLRIRQFRLFKD